MRITLDSTILVRANQRTTGPARALLLEVLQRGHSLVLSASVLEEVERVLHYPRLLKRFGLTKAEITGFVAFLAAAAEIVEIDENLTAPIRDPKDVHILQTAIGGNADYLCTLDGHFKETLVVDFCSNHGIAVISDLDLLHLVRQAGSEENKP
ncbi:MAG: putative toxin-antitoxin system toxin component, PIN family [Bryobacteraceae bacterium]